MNRIKESLEIKSPSKEFKQERFDRDEVGMSTITVTNNTQPEPMVIEAEQYVIIDREESNRGSEHYAIAVRTCGNLPFMVKAAVNLIRTIRETGDPIAYMMLMGELMEDMVKGQ